MTILLRTGKISFFWVYLGSMKHSSFHCPYQKREIDLKAFGELVDWVGIDKNAEKIEMDWNQVADEGMIDSY